MNNDTLSMAKDYALKLGIAPCVSGYAEFAEAVTEYVHEDKALPIKEVCKNIGQTRSLGTDTVFRAIGYALKTANDIKTRLSEIAGIPVQESDIRPKYVICLVAQCIQRDLGE